MKSAGRACSILLLMMAAVSSGRCATEYFQQADFLKPPAWPEDTLVFFTVAAPPLMCELEKDGDWVGGDRSESDLILTVQASSSIYTCTFLGHETTYTNLKLLRNSLHSTFYLVGERKIEFRDSELACTADSQLPDEYFQLKVQRPNEKYPVQCRMRNLEKTLHLRFPRYPTIICKWFGLASQNQFYRFKLPGIVGDPFECAFLLYSDMRIVNTNTEKRLYQSLISILSSHVGGDRPRVICSHNAVSNGTTHFQVRLPGDKIYDCSFANLQDAPL